MQLLTSHIHLDKRSLNEALRHKNSAELKRSGGERLEAENRDNCVSSLTIINTQLKHGNLLHTKLLPSNDHQVTQYVEENLGITWKTSPISYPSFDLVSERLLTELSLNPKHRYSPMDLQ